MARINIEDQLHSEKEFKRLIRIVGNEDTAVGLLYRFWRAAQDYWGNEYALMPKADFIVDGFEPLLAAGFAIERQEGIYALGSEKQFSWYLQRRRASRSAGMTKNTSSGQPERQKTPVPVIPLPLPLTLTLNTKLLSPITQSVVERGNGKGDTHVSTGNGEKISEEEKSFEEKVAEISARALRKQNPKTEVKQNFNELVDKISTVILPEPPGRENDSKEF
jgi:hypothetical protein